jgi:hypothetical protein
MGSSSNRRTGEIGGNLVYSVFWGDKVKSYGERSSEGLGASSDSTSG